VGNLVAAWAVVARANGALEIGMNVVRMGRGLGWLAVCTLTLAGVAPAGQPSGATGAAEEKTTSSVNPSVDDIIKRYVDVTGGEAAYKKITSRVLTAKMMMSGPGMEFKVVSTQKAPGKMLTVTSSEATGESKQGTDGDIVWEISQGTGERVLTGSEREDMLRRASIMADVTPRAFFETIELTGVEEVGGKDAYVLKMTPKSGESVTNYYDKESGLLVRTKMTLTHPMGKLEMTVNMSDYREVDGIRIPFRNETTVKGLPIKMDMTVEKVEHNTVIDDSIFAVPQEIKDLLQEQKEEEERKAKDAKPADTKGK
jgi:outer membrane lipoprotein-sorting protein